METFDFTSGTVLVVDDDRSIREYIQYVLQREKFEVMTFADAGEALRKLAENGRVVAVISDIDMPEMNGLVFAADVASRFPRLPMLMISGDHGYETSEAHRSFLSKPFGPQALVRALRGLMRVAYEGVDVSGQLQAACGVS